MKLLIFILFSFFILSMPLSNVKAADNHFFEIQSIDTMKFSRDEARNKAIIPKIAPLVKEIADLHVTHIAIGTPYDEEFVPFMKLWVHEARKNHVHVWFRGNFSSWEGWFDYPKFTNVNDHHKMTYAFITSHPDLFEDGDIFTPAPEAENGVMGDPRSSYDKAQLFNQFLVDSYANCVNAFQAIHKNVTCGFYSTNGDVAKQVLTKDTVKRIGNLVTIDHYVKTPEQLVSDVKYLHDKFDAPVMIGEFGAPIPDINGDMNDAEQAEYIKSDLVALLTIKNIVKGVNYWTAVNGTTSIFDSNLQPKQAAHDISSIFEPLVISGSVLDVFEHPVDKAQVSNKYESVSTDASGHYSILTYKDDLNIKVIKNGYKEKNENVKFTENTNQLTQNVELDIQKKDFWYRVQLFLRSFNL